MTRSKFESCSSLLEITFASPLGRKMTDLDKPQNRTFTGLRVDQWLPEWDSLEFDESAHRRRPKPYFYLFSIPAQDLKRLTGIHRRSTVERSSNLSDTGIQRAHQATRSREIGRFIQYGFPWSDLSETRRRSGNFKDLRKPGWLPTAIVVNIVANDDIDNGNTAWSVDDEDLVEVLDVNENFVKLEMPKSFENADWIPKRNHPIQVIDGQHRLWAFDEDRDQPEYDLPVVAFHGLDVSWRAYLFYTINIKPERINASLAYDLYPLLRTEDWLSRFEGPGVYRETRSQELTYALWSNPTSPWHNHINMLGERGLKRMVRQAAWIRSLMATYVKSARGTAVGGLFGERPGKEVLHWNGAQQAAFLIHVGQKMRDAVVECDHPWVEALRVDDEGDEEHDNRAFYGAHSLLNTDQGVRGLLSVTNDLCYVRSNSLGLDEWFTTESSGASDQLAVDAILKDLDELPVSGFLADLSSELASFDWRTSSAPDLLDVQRTFKSAFRGSGGYRELRRQLLDHLRNGTGDVSDAANEVVHSLRY